MNVPVFQLLDEQTLKQLRELRNTRQMVRQYQEKRQQKKKVHRHRSGGHK